MCLVVYSLRVSPFGAVLCNASSCLDVHSPGFSDMEAPSQLRDHSQLHPRELPAHIIWPQQPLPLWNGASICGLETLAFIMLANGAEFHYQLEKKPGPFPTAAMTSECIHLCLKLGNHFPGGPFSNTAQSSLSKSFSSGFVCLYPRGLAW